MNNQIPDRVPVTPDISNYIPCKMAGLPFWDIYFFEEVQLWKLYIQAAAYFGIEMWIVSCMGTAVRFESRKVEYQSNIHYDRVRDAMIRQTTIHTPEGELTTESLCFRNEPPVPIVKAIKSFEKDWKKYRWLLSEPVGLEDKLIEETRSECRRHGQAFGLSIDYPGFHHWNSNVHGGVEQLTYAFYDTPEILEEWFELDLAIGTRTLELLLEVKPDYLLFGGSGTLTLASPELVRKFSLPAISKWSNMAAEAGVTTLLHSCGKSRELVDMLVKHTRIDCINPLEMPPMGDVDLAELKQARGKQIAFMGNLHTTNTMLKGSAEEVFRASKEAIISAGEGGGFILSTGDQCGLDTPYENIFAMVEAAKEYGVYDGDTGKLMRLSSRDERGRGRERGNAR